MAKSTELSKAAFSARVQEPSRRINNASMICCEIHSAPIYVDEGASIFVLWYGFYCGLFPQ
jgi:hypothetical protein